MAPHHQGETPQQPHTPARVPVKPLFTEAEDPRGEDAADAASKRQEQLQSVLDAPDKVSTSTPAGQRRRQQPVEAEAGADVKLTDATEAPLTRDQLAEEKAAAAAREAAAKEAAAEQAALSAALEASAKAKARAAAAAASATSSSGDGESADSGEDTAIPEEGSPPAVDQGEGEPAADEAADKQGSASGPADPLGAS